MNITIEDLEKIAAAAEATIEARREKLMRLIRAYARIVAAANRDAFERLPTEYADVDGHWDSSYPPEQEWKNRTGPRAVVVDELDWERIATSEGAYYDYKIVGTDPGLYVDSRGQLWGGTIEGAGRFEHFAAHPGSCDVRAEVEWDPLTAADVDVAALERAEKQLRELAFPLVAKRMAEAGA